MGYESSKSEIKPVATYDEVVKLIKELRVALDRIAPIDNKFLTVKQVAEELQITRRQANNLTSPLRYDSRRLRSVLIDKQRRVKRQWLDAYIERWGR